MSYTTQQLAGAINRKDRQPNVTFPYVLESEKYRWTVTNQKHAPVIYVVQAENGLFKIGRALNVVTRIVALDRASPIPINFFHLILTNNAYELERELHEQFTSLWIRGEWFQLGAAERDLITALDYKNFEITRYPGDYTLWRDHPSLGYGEIKVERK